MKRLTIAAIIFSVSFVLIGAKGCGVKEKGRFTADKKRSVEQQYQLAYALWRSNHDRTVDGMKSRNPLRWKASFNRLNSSLRNMSRYVRLNHPERAEEFAEILSGYERVFNDMIRKGIASGGLINTMDRLRTKVHHGFRLGKLDPKFYNEKRQKVRTEKELLEEKEKVERREKRERQKDERKRRRAEKKRRKQAEGK